MREKLEVALRSLDPDNNDHWTSDGSPKLDVLTSIIGDRVTRALVTKEFPLYNREYADRQDDPEPKLQTSLGPEPEENDLFQAVDDAEKTLLDARRLVDEAEKYLTDAQENYGVVLKARDDAYPPLSNTQNIRDYLDEQQRQRIARGTFADAFVRKQDVAFLAKAKIDQAFISKKKFGQHRPVHPRVAKQG